MTFLDQINAQLTQFRLLPLNSEQLECLNDRSRLKEAAGMLDDLAARCAVQLPHPSGTEHGAFATEEEAREQAEQLAQNHGVVWLDELATDEGRSFGDDEFYVRAFDGPDAALAAALGSSVLACWVEGTEVAAPND
jgi:hypothetical protein